MNIKLRPSDIICSRYYRKLVGHCEKCGRKGCGKEGIEGLQVSHFYGRRNESTRYLRLNLDILCFFCHQYFEERPREYNEWKLKKIGEKAMKELDLAVNTYQKRDDKLSVLYFKNLMKELN